MSAEQTPPPEFVKASDEPREAVCSVCGMDPLDSRGEGEVCTACGGGVASDDPGDEDVMYRCAHRSGMSEEGARRYIQQRRDHKRRDVMWEQLGDLWSDENAPVIAAVIAEVAHQTHDWRHEPDPLRQEIKRAAHHIREAMRLKAGANG